MYISKEIVQRDDLSKYSLKKRVDHVVRSTSVPTDKLSQSRSYYPSTRALEDYWLHNSGKPWRSLRAMGCSVNPEYLKGMSSDVLGNSRLPCFLILDCQMCFNDFHLWFPLQK